MIMNLLKIVAFLSFTTSVALGQSIVIGYPPNGASVPAGQNLTVQIERPDTLTGSIDVSVAIGLMSCGARPCPPASDVMGDILFKGPFNPQFHEPIFPPYQNYCVPIPASFAKGPAQLNVAHFTLIGAGPFPFLDTWNTSIIIV